MKTIKFYTQIAFLFSLLLAVSCVQDDEFDVPAVDVVSYDVPDERLLTIDGVRTLLEAEIFETNDDNALYLFETDENIDNDLFVVGYVISNDAAGNFFEELILQDNFENPTRGVKVLIDANPLSVTYQVGRRVFIKLEGLSVGFDSGVLSLGIADGSSLEKMAESQQDDFLFRDDEVATIVPMSVNINDFTDLMTNTYVRVNDVQFNRNDVLGDNPKTYAAEPSDEFDGERNLESCASGSTVIFSTSTFADFKGITMPAGRGSIDAILTRDFFGEVFNLVINDPTTVNLDGTDRCDPDTFNCTGASGGGDAFYSENFEGDDAIEDYVDAGWTNVNVNGGSTVWEIDNFSGNNYAMISGFNTDEDDIDTWLVMPGIDLDSTIEEELNFEIQASFDTGTILSVLVSTNFMGDVTTADWALLDAAIPVGPIDGFGDFEGVGPINISCIDGTVNFAFLYEGSDPSATTRYHIDNIEITGN